MANAQPLRKSARVTATLPAANAGTNATPRLPTEEIEAFAGDPNFMTSLARGLAVIRGFSHDQRRQSISQLSQKTGIPRAAVRRCLYTLARLGYVGSDDGRLFALQPRLLVLGHAYLSSTPLVIAAQPYLDRVSEAVDESCSLAMLEGDDILYLARSVTSRIISITLNVGGRLPAYATSIGLVLLAALPEEALERYLEHVRINRYTDRTPTTPAALRRLLQSVRRDGYAVADQMMEIGVVSVAVPVRDSAGRVVAGMNVITQTARSSSAELLAKSLAPLSDAACDLAAQIETHS
ncbi:MAG TPA: IclR family transcriptional regulator C-terminal domain-containing protein [Casimicrobiaceae bacterium]|nr:IclR family transcriptional regulator C-terminal domain-containing protein [Casimicrobiaceae bacterium]